MIISVQPHSLLLVEFVSGKFIRRKIRFFLNELEKVLVYFVLASLPLQDAYLALYVKFRQEFPGMVILNCDVIGSGYKFPLSNNSLLHNYFFRLYLHFIIILACTIIRYPKVSNLEMCSMLFLQYIW